MNKVDSISDVNIFKSVMDNITDFIGICGLDFIPSYVNKSGMSSVGLDSLEQSQQTTVAGFFFQEDVDFIMNQFFPIVFETGKNECEIRFKHFKTGQPIWMIFNVVLVKDANENAVGYATISKNITKQKTAEEKIKSSEGNLKFMIHQAPVAISILRGSDYVVEIANNNALELWGKKEKDVLNKPILKAMPELLPQGIKELLDEVYNTGKRFTSTELPIEILKSGKPEKRYINFSYEPLYNIEGNINGIMPIGFDVTEQVIARQKIEANEEKLNIVIDAGEVGTYELNLKTDTVESSERFRQIFGYKQGEKLTHGAFLNHLHSDDVLIRNNAFKKALKTGNLQYQSRIIWKDKSIHYIEVKGKIFYDNNDKPEILIGTGRDITVEKNQQLQLEESEQRYHQLIYSSPFAIGILYGEDLIITIANDAIIEIWGKGKEIMGKAYFEALPELAEQGYKEVFAEVYKTGKPFNAIETAVNILQNGRMQLKYYNFLLYAQKNLNGEINGIGIIATEVTSNALLNKQAKESEKRFRDLIMNSPVPKAILKGKEHVVEMANTVLLKNIWRKKESDVTGKKILEVLPELKEQKYAQLLNEVYNTGKTHAESESLIFINGDDGLNTFYIDFEYAPLIESDNRISGIKITAIDVTDKVKARLEVEESEQKFRLLADSMPQFVWTGDAKGNLNYFNQAVYNYSGLSPQEIQQNGWIQIVHPDEREKNIAAWINSITTGTDFIFEHRFRKHSGEYRWQLSRAIPQKDVEGNIQMWVGTSTDIQEIKELEQQKDFFISMASHELKTPITSIKGYVQIFQKMYANSEDTFLKNSLTIIDRQVVTLSRLIADLLDLSKIKSGSFILNKEKFPVNNLVNEIIEEIKLVNPDYQFTFSAKKEITVNADRNRIGQVLINFLTNAVKYSPKSKEVEIESDVADNNIIISVKDSGIGINKNDQEKIFERFYRVEGKNEKTFPGFGIGLFIASEIIHKHNGKIGVRSEVGKGSIFYFSIPINNN